MSRASWMPVLWVEAFTELAASYCSQMERAPGGGARELGEEAGVPGGRGVGVEDRGGGEVLPSQE